MAPTLMRPVSEGEVDQAAKVAGNRKSTTQLYERVLSGWRAARGIVLPVSRADIAAAARARGQHLTTGECARDTWRYALQADRDRLVLGRAGTDRR